MATNQTKSAYYSLLAATVGAGVALTIFHATIPNDPPLLPLPVSVTDMQEDDPGWDCFEHGNRICGDPEGVHASTAWEAWDRTEAWKRLNLDPSQPFRVDYVGSAHLSPDTAPDEVAVPARDGNWYVFRAVTEGK